MTLVTFDADQQYSLSKVKRVSNTIAAQTSANSYDYIVLQTKKARRIDIQAINLNTTESVKIFIGGNLYGIDADYNPADTLADLSNIANRVTAFDSIVDDDEILANNGTNSNTKHYSITTPYEFIYFLPSTGVNNKQLSYIAYIVASS